MNFGVYYPTQLNPVSTVANAIVRPGIEFPNIENLSPPGSFAVPINADVDVTGRQVFIDYSVFSRTASSSFNGYVFNFAGNNTPAITGVSLGLGTTFSPTEVTLSFDADSVFVNIPSLPINPSSQIVVDLQLAPKK